MRRLAIAALFTALIGVETAGAGTPQPPNLIVNGDFSHGSVGFTTDYAKSGPGRNSLWGDQTYTIGVDPHHVHDHWVTMSGAPMMIVNGGTSPTPVVWEENNIATTTGGTYNFSAKVADICCYSPATDGLNAPHELEFQVSTDGGSTFKNIVGDINSPQSDRGVWVTLTGTFASKAGGAFDIRLMDSQTLEAGNDFGLTGISVTAAPAAAAPIHAPAVPEPATWAMMMMGVGALGMVLRGQRRADRAPAAMAA
jgi:hypothetical protein